MTKSKQLAKSPATTPVQRTPPPAKVPVPYTQPQLHREVVDERLFDVAHGTPKKPTPAATDSIQVILAPSRITSGGPKDVRLPKATWRAISRAALEAGDVGDMFADFIPAPQAKRLANLLRRQAVPFLEEADRLRVVALLEACVREGSGVRLTERIR